MHEIKKDNQRIFAGLSKLLLDKNVAEYVEGHELAEMIVRINEKYAEMLEKDIRFSKHIEGEHAAYHVYTVLSIFNNLAANAVEAIEDKGVIIIKLYKRDQHIFLK